MARKLRVEYPGAIYHVMNRGDHREPICQDDDDRREFLRTLAETCLKTTWAVHAWCLMANHFHLVIETPHGNLVAGMKWFLGNYTRRFNRRHKLFGHLFSGRYKALPVDGSGNGYLRTVCDYVHLNPARARCIAEDAPLRSYEWSSFGEYLKPPAQRPAWLRVDRLLGELGIPRDSEAGRATFEQMLEARRQSELEEEFKPLRRGWCVGSESFRRELLAQVAEKQGAWHYGPELVESAIAKAERLIATALVERGWTEAHLTSRRKGDGFKVALAAKLRRETTVTLSWIAERLHMGVRGHLTHLLYREAHTPTDNPNQTQLWK